METSNPVPRWVLAIVGGFIVSYCVLVLGVVATAPDLRLRFLLVDMVSADSGVEPVGIEIRQAPSPDKCYGPAPDPGDFLVLMGQQPVTNFLDFARTQHSLRSREIPPSGILSEGTNPLAAGLPALVQEADGTRWLRIEYLKGKSKNRATCAIQLQSVPSSEVGLTLIWFLLQLLIFSVGLFIDLQY